MDYEIKYLECIHGTPAVHLAHKALVEIDEAGHGFRQVVVRDSQKAFVAYLRGEAVALLLFTQYDFDNSIHINVSYTLPDYRGQDINTDLWKKLLEFADRQGARHITTGVHVNNKAQQSNCDKRGMEADTISYTYDMEKYHGRKPR